MEGSAPYLGPAEQEQNHYLAQLFGLYGENGTLTAGGLARLLHSLGLGRVPQALRLGHHGPPGSPGVHPQLETIPHTGTNPSPPPKVSHPSSSLLRRSLLRLAAYLCLPNIRFLELHVFQILICCILSRPLCKKNIRESLTCHPIHPGHRTPS